jgi:hypothetical protein
VDGREVGEAIGAGRLGPRGTYQPAGDRRGRRTYAGRRDSQVTHGGAQLSRWKFTGFFALTSKQSPLDLDLSLFHPHKETAPQGAG